LLWAHAEYIKLLRSVRDGWVFDLIPEAADRYTRNRRALSKVQFWSFQHPSRAVKSGSTLRIHADNAFRIHFSRDNWATATDIDSASTNLGIDCCDIPIPEDQRAPLRFTFFWRVANRWEGSDFEVACTE
jgi:glucoamylase